MDQMAQNVENVFERRIHKNMVAAENDSLSGTPVKKGKIEENVSCEHLNYSFRQDYRVCSQIAF